MQLHRQLPKLREGGARRGEDLSDLEVEQHYGGQAHTRAPSCPEPLAPPQTPLSPAPRPGGRAGSQLGGPALPWPPGSAIREGGRTFVDADVMASRTSSRRRCRRRFHGAGTAESRTTDPLRLQRRKSHPSPQLIGSNRSGLPSPATAT